MADEQAIPILLPDHGERPLLWHDGCAVSRATVLAEALKLAKSLPDQSHAINACQSRYSFIVAWLAALLRNQVMVLPNDRTERVFISLAQRYPGLYCLSDGASPAVDMPSVSVAPGHDAATSQALSLTTDPPTVPADRAVAIAFTSGSTGEPQPNEKTLRILATTGRLIADRFNLAGTRPAALVATVPAQHMYGLETSITVPLWAGASVHSGRPFYPADIAMALSALPAPRVLVTTPIHLKALLSANNDLPKIDKLISATAPLSEDIARQAEDRFDTEVWEIFGFSEAGTIATRRTIEGPLWRSCDSLTIVEEAEGCFVAAPHFPAPIPFNDVVMCHSKETFELQGRASDSVNIAGKRASMNGLNAILNDIEGVGDGAFYLADEDSKGKVTRPLAFVVAEAHSPESIKAALRKAIDPAFLPRQVYLVPALPRSETGKLTRAALANLLQSMRDAKP